MSEQRMDPELAEQVKNFAASTYFPLLSMDLKLTISLTAQAFRVSDEGALHDLQSFHNNGLQPKSSPAVADRSILISSSDTNTHQHDVERPDTDACYQLERPIPARY